MGDDQGDGWSHSGVHWLIRLDRAGVLSMSAEERRELLKAIIAFLKESKDFE